MKEEIKRENQTVFQPCQSNDCQQLQMFIEEEVGEFALDSPPIAFLKLFNVKTTIPSDSNRLLFAFLDDLRNSMSSLIVSNYHQYTFPKLEISQARGLLFDLLTEGTGGGANAIDDKNEAKQIIKNLFDWCGEDCYFYTNWNRNYRPNTQDREYSYPLGGGGGHTLFQVSDYSAEEGLIFVSSSRAGIFWFFGED